MDARETLRRYLEQRREAGESELVLDSLSVEDAMRLIGVKGATTGVPRPTAQTPAASGTRATTSDVTDTKETGDWRAALRAVDAGPPATKSPTPTAPIVSEREPRDETPAIGGGRLGFEVSPATQASTSKAGAEESSLSQVPAGISVGSSGRELFSGSASAWNSVDDIVRAVAACTLCPLSREAKNPVPGEGSLTAGLMCVGEAPGATEDEQGRPFVGAAGQLLTKILAAIQLAREDVYICNVLKHRPPGNRNPLPSEVDACSPYLIRQIELIQPRVIVAFGTFAAQTLLNTKEAIGKLRGRIHRYYGVPLVVTYHPAALLRNPAWKRPTWEDVQLARRLLDRPSTEQ
ncbi:MAG: uracil-DNA glycosylase [Gemmatimonadaceae bacterium]